MANLPVESMTTGGCLWFPDLTIAQPFYGLPLMTAVTLWLTIEVSISVLLNLSLPSKILLSVRGVLFPKKEFEII